MQTVPELKVATLKDCAAGDFLLIERKGEYIPAIVSGIRDGDNRMVVFLPRTSEASLEAHWVHESCQVFRCVTEPKVHYSVSAIRSVNSFQVGDMVLAAEGNGICLGLNHYGTPLLLSFVDGVTLDGDSSGVIAISAYKIVVASADGAEKTVLFEKT